MLAQHGLSSQLIVAYGQTVVVNLIELRPVQEKYIDLNLQPYCDFQQMVAAAW